MFRFVRTCGFALIVVFVALAAHAQNPAPPVIQGPFVKTAPKIDGVLDDDCWKDLPDYTGFVDKTTRQTANRQTEVKICYDDTSIYVAFHAHHPDPKRIMAMQTKRNGDFLNEDCVTICIDSQYQHRDDSTFRVNALGTMVESLQRSATDNIQFKGDWQGAAKIVDDGYTVEMAIPFSLLVYNNNCDKFGLCFARRIPEEHVTSVWPDLNGMDDLRYYCVWQGIKPPSNKPTTKTLGYLIGSAGGGINSRVYRGFDTRIPFSNNMAGVLSVKPDFSSVEQNVQSINFSYTERYQADYRPFFSEWDFPMDGEVFYSQRIPEFDAGAKLSYKAGPQTIGLLNTVSLDHEYNTVLGYQRNIGDLSNFCFDVANHDIPGGNNLVTYYAAKFKKMCGQRSYKMAGGLYQSWTTDAPNGQAHWFSLSSSGGNGELCASFSYNDVGSTFDPEIGYCPTINYKGPDFWLWRSTTYRNRKIESVYNEFGVDSYDHQDGSLYSNYWCYDGSVTMSNGQGISYGLSRDHRELSTDIAPNLGFFWNSDKQNKSGGVSMTWGRLAGGRHTYISGNQKFCLSKRLVIGASTSREIIDQPSISAGSSRQTWATVNYDITNERSVAGRVVWQDGNANLFLIFRQKVRRGTDAYLIFGDPNTSDTVSKISFKLERVL